MAQNNQEKDPVFGTFATMDEAAEHFIRFVGQRSINENTEYYAVIFAHRNSSTKKDEYSFSPPKAGTMNSSAGLVSLFIKGVFTLCRQAATVHTHGGYGGDCTDLPSNADCNVLGSLATAYIATPSGNVYKIEKGKGISRVYKTIQGAWQACFHVRPVEGLGVWRSGFAYDPGDPGAWANKSRR